MFIINVWLTVKDPRNCDRVGELLAQMAEGVRKEDGCARFAAYRSESEPVRFLLNEHWQSREHWEAHRGARICKEIYEPLVLPLVTREAHPCSLVA